MNYLQAVFIVSCVNFTGWITVAMYVRRILKSACVLDCLAKDIRNESNRPPALEVKS